MRCRLAGGPGVRGEPDVQQPFDLGTSTSLDEPPVRVPVHGVRVQGGRKQVALAVAVPERVPA